MKRTILFLALTLSIASFSQTNKKWRGNFLLNGQIENKSVNEVTLHYTADTKRGVVTDTLNAVVGEGKFSFSGFIEEPIFATLTVGDNKMKLFLDPAIMQVVIRDDNSRFTINGSPTSDDYIEIEELRRGFSKKNKKELAGLYEKKQNAPQSDFEELSKIMSDIAKLEGEADLSALTFAAKDRGSFAVLKALDDFLNPENKYYKRDICAQIMRIYAQMPEHMKDTPTGVNVSGKLLKARMNMQF